MNVKEVNALIEVVDYLKEELEEVEKYFKEDYEPETSIEKSVKILTTYLADRGD